MTTSFPLNSNPPSTGTPERLSFGFEKDDGLSVLVVGSEAVDGTPITTRLRANVQVDQFPQALEQACAELGIAVTGPELRALLLSLAKHGSLLVRATEQARTSGDQPA